MLIEQKPQILQKIKGNIRKNKVCVALPAEEAMIYLCAFYLQFLIIKQLSALPLEKDSSGFLS